MGELARKPDLQIVRQLQGTALDYHIQIFLEAKAGRSPKTFKGYSSVLYLFRDHAGPYTWPVTPEAIDAFLNGCKSRGLKVSSIDSYYMILKLWLNWLYRRGKIESNPIALAEKPPHSKSIPRAPKVNDLQKFFGFLKAAARKGDGHWLDVRALAFWSLALDTGLRVGEITTLTVNDLTIEKGHRLAHIRNTKTNRDRVVYFDKRTGKDLKRWLKVRLGLPLPAGIDALFVCYVRGKWGPLTSWGARQALTRRCEEWNLPHLRPHDFRHAHAVYWIRKRGNLLDLQKQLGHQNLTTTARYTLTDDEARGKRHRKHSPRGKL